MYHELFKPALHKVVVIMPYANTSCLFTSPPICSAETTADPRLYHRRHQAAGKGGHPCLIRLTNAQLSRQHDNHLISLHFGASCNTDIASTMSAPGVQKERLSHDFFELYRSYKRKTKTVLGWLAEACSLTDISITACVAAARSVRKQKISVPPALYYVCKDALTLRITVAEQYKRQILANGLDEAKGQAIESHDFFISK